MYKVRETRSVDMCVQKRAILAFGSVSIPEENGWFWTTSMVPMQALLKEVKRLRGVLLES
jgi:hypothetical protein